MRKGLISSSLSRLFDSRKKVLIILIIILIVVGGFLAYMTLSNPNIKIQPLSNSGGHYIDPERATNDYYEYRMYANITGMKNDGQGYYCVCTFYNKNSSSNEVLEQSTIKLDNYSKRNPATSPCGLIRTHNYYQVSKVEIAVFNSTGNLLNYEVYNWDNNPNLITIITDSVFRDDF